MEMKAIKQTRFQDLEIEDLGGDIIRIYHGDAKYSASYIPVEKESLPSFHKAIGEFLPQVEVSEEESVRDTVKSSLGKHLPACNCGELYTSRNLTAPDCVWCNYSEDLEDDLVANLSLLSQSKQEKWISEPDAYVVLGRVMDKMEAFQYQNHLIQPIKYLKPLPPTKGAKDK